MQIPQIFARIGKKVNSYNLYIPLDVFAPDDAFLLCNRGKKGKGEHAGLLLKPEIFHFKIDIDAEQLEGVQHFQCIHRIACKPADGFGEDQVDFCLLYTSRERPDSQRHCLQL